MSFAGGLWSSINRMASQALMNLKTNLVGTGDEILGVSAGSLRDGMIASVTADSTGGALKAGIHRRSGGNWVSPQGGIHFHQSTSDGGRFQDLLIQAITNTWYANYPGVSVNDFRQTGTGTPTYANVVSGTDAYAQITTSTTTSHSGNLRYGGFTLTFTQPIAFVTRIQLADSTTLSQARCGINMETAEAATDNKPKFGFEGCSTCNSSSMSIISAQSNGGSPNRSKNTTSADNYATVGNFAMVLTPGVNVKYRKEAGTIITKTNDIPSVGTSDRANTFIAGIQTATTAAKILRIYGFSAVGNYGDTMPVIT